MPPQPPTVFVVDDDEGVRNSLRFLLKSVGLTARTLASALGSIEGIRAPRFEAPYLGEFTIELERGTAAGFLDRLRRRRVLGGHPLADPRPGAPKLPERILVAPSEAVGEKEIARYATAANAWASAPGGR